MLFRSAEKAKINAEQAMNEAEQRGYEIGIAETEKALRAEVPEVCRIYCVRTWSEALNRAGVEASSELVGQRTYITPRRYAPPLLNPIRLTPLLQLLTLTRRFCLVILLLAANRD